MSQQATRSLRVRRTATWGPENGVTVDSPAECGPANQNDPLPSNRLGQSWPWRGGRPGPVDTTDPSASASVTQSDYDHETVSERRLFWYSVVQPRVARASVVLFPEVSGRGGGIPMSDDVTPDEHSPVVADVIPNVILGDRIEVDYENHMGGTTTRTGVVIDVWRDGFRFRAKCQDRGDVTVVSRNKMDSGTDLELKTQRITDHDRATYRHLTDLSRHGHEVRVLGVDE